ncbi:ATP-binding protein [Rhodococcus sp. BP-252]|uniref:ATP-dependent nuclease n=1 Tax=unclassified Rhodococcus (in: high G+C Gram-positive bacteria) TaxID=192944 RepID=UPI001C9A9F2B|nr:MULTISPECIES: ATP-binding protein [unclassified Rhodococcus (in: high G+C Gram-positive bacteria)]MBY6414418.1 ATP-binding protein [Rhodococcus sp. BP-320]MBY6419135.1 ATP-binding protein [Rhodococcus sp. BP-321]MBY6423979.1 ATP-binding protein [Rhodococcus sp. BP-324]MBY6429310.1 ATP-binding protein [Rhodococcus sp. BP-323]MBY6434271.1 ATP-binding protein [Rhodococcus sp. BP-322]
MEWTIGRRFISLVGAGDSTKTTLLDAIGLVLSPSYSPQFTDADFFNLDLSKSIVIEAAVTDLPDTLVKESQLGKDRSGIMPDGTLVHDPVDEAEECLVLRLTVTPELEPTWEVVRPDSDDARTISASQRRQLGFFRLGERPDFHLRWARGSALSGLTEGGDGASSVILDAHREARAAVFAAEPNPLHAAAAEAQTSARAVGAATFGNLRPGLEPVSASSTHALMLHDGDVPLSGLGLGTRRLTSLAIQDQAMAHGSIIAIDEIEHGLEPHRLAQTLYHLRQRTAAGQLQVIMTTHSPTAIQTMSAVDFVVVQSDGAGSTTCRPVPEDLDNVQGTFRSAPAALLGRRVLVGEGATEVGFLRGLLRHWDAEQISKGEVTAAVVGTVLVNGAGGTQPTQRAQNFQHLGYSTCMLVDNDDREVDDSVAQARAAGVEVYRWTPDNSLEDEVVKTLAIAGLQAVVDLAVEIKGEQSIQASVSAKLGGQQIDGTDVTAWRQQAGVDELTVRNAIAGAAVAKKKEWFKREDRGEELAGVVIAHWDGLESSHLMKVIGKLQDFAYPTAATPTAAKNEKPAGA